MNKQFQILKWTYQNQKNFPLKSGKMFQAYEETEDYDAAQNAFSELLSKLHNKSLLEKVEYGTYDISDRGAQKVKNYIYGDSKDIVRPDNYKDVVKGLDRYFMERRISDIRTAALNGEDFRVDLQKVEKFNVDLLEGFFSDNPESFIDAIEEALERATDASEAPSYRIIPNLEWLEIPLDEAITSSNLEKPVIVSGIIKSREQVCKIITSATFECSDCGDECEKDQGSGNLKSPYKCDCGSRKFETKDRKVKDVIDFQLSHRDKQETRLKARIMGDPDIDGEAQQELMSGTKVRILGVPKLLESKHKNTEKREVRLKAFDYKREDRKKAISEIDEAKKKHVLQKIKDSDDPFEAFAKSIAPNLGGMDLPKKCIAAALIGAPETKRNETTDYGRIHVGVMSNPGIGKSHLQEWVSDRFEKSYKTEGKSGTGTGLTASVEQKKGGEWQLIAGKLVFADRGILQIDEFDKFKEGELTSLNTAMESGFFSVDKASVSARLPGRATVIATGNFAGKLEDHQKVYEMLPEKGEGLYDRFALMCAVTDTGKEAEEKIGVTLLAPEERSEHEQELFHVPFDPEELRVYRYLARKCDPSGLSREAVSLIKNYVRASKENSKGNLRGESNRIFGHLGKLTMAIARSNLREGKATESDARKATKLMRECRDSLDLKLGDAPGQKYKESRKLNSLKQTYKELLSGEDSVAIEDLKREVLSEKKMDPKEFEDALKTLKNNGSIYEPEPGMVAEL